MRFSVFPLLVLVLGMLSPALPAQEAELVTLRFLSFPKNASPQPVELFVGDGKTIEVKTPTNALSEPYHVNRLASWSFGKLHPAQNEDEKPVFKSYGSAPAIASDNQIILLIRHGKENADGLRVVPLDNKTDKFGGGQFFFMNASKVDVAGMLGGTQFAIKPGNYTIIEPKEVNRRQDGGTDGHFTEFFFRKESETRPFFSSTWPANKKARSMVFFYHDPHNERLRMHTIRDYLP